MNLKIPDNFRLPHISIKWGRVRDSLRSRLRKLPCETRMATQKLAEKGWFLSDDIGFSAIKSLANSVDETTEVALVGFYKAQIDQILADLKASFPERSHLFQSALEAHKQKNYDASIPLLLAQADGICIDILGEKMFSRRKRTPQTKNAVKNRIEDHPIGELMEAFVEPLFSGSALMLTESEMKDKRRSDSGYNVLNRHEIMHGLDKDYGSETNSLKVISLLNYLNCIKKHLQTL